MAMISTSAPRSFFRLAGLATVLSFGVITASAQQSTTPPDEGPDPALANMAPADAAAMQQNNASPNQNAGQPDSVSGPPPQQEPAPIVRSAPTALSQPGQPDDAYNAPPTSEDNPQADSQVSAGEDALDDADISSDQAPPALPDYDQPEAPGDNYMWTPGYWGYANAGYYWVPGVWIVPPYYGALWTPCYWGWYGGRYRWHRGYWGLHIGFYGGVNYGFGYIGTGFFGGYWRGNAFIYNRSVTNVGGRVGYDHVYNRTVVYNHTTYGAQPVNRISYNGGHGGINAAPRPAEFVAMHEAHTAPLAGQMRLRTSAAQNPQAAFSANHGRPAVAAMERPLGATRPIASNPAEFQQRQPLSQQQINRTFEPRSQTQQQPRPQMQQSRPQPQSRPAPVPRPESHSAPAPRDSGGGKH